MTQNSNDFLGTQRFHLRRRLGSGGMGVVYEAHDVLTDKIVALKTLSRAEASNISRFKQEFRSLAHVSHPNLVSLYEFMADGQYWFFTMELVHGVDFLEYVRPGYQAKRAGSLITPTLRKARAGAGELLANYEAITRQLTDLDEVSEDDDSTHRSETEASLARSRLDLERLRSAARQLVEGLIGLHEIGKLHRDIKPSNVLVTGEGRVVILDFGLVAEVESKGLHDSIILAGTPDYMSPEQGAQLPISAASDWYSVGVILYQALTAKLPFAGKFFEVMMNKQNFDPPAPAELLRGVPPDLNDLCVRLLRRNPRERPTGKEILRLLGHRTTGPLRGFIAANGPQLARTAPFVGRRSQLRQLNEALSLARRGQTVSVYLHGSSGMGKTSLIHHFLAELRQQDGSAVILEGRCYERESVPYKALDGVVDSLTKYLMSLSDEKAQSLMPKDVSALALLFPVMLQVDSVFNAPPRDLDVTDALALRRRAFAALRELLDRISARQMLVLYIDDLQWSDADSTMLLEGLLRPPGAPRLLLLSSFRSEDIESRPFLESLLKKTGTETCREVLVDALPKNESRDLLRDLLGANASVVEPFTEAMLREARGNPFLLEQLAGYAINNDQTATSGISLGMMLEARLRNQPRGARQFLNTLAVAGRPINPEVVYQAANLSGDELPLVSSLRAAQFLRSGGEGHTIELYHDRIRETLAAQIDAATTKQIHRGLAKSIEARGIDDPEALFEHYMGAGEQVRASAHAAVAAKKAAAALAFDRAAAFYRRAMEFAPAYGAELIDLKRGLAVALTNAGRPAEAAQAYLDLAPMTSAHHALDFKRRAAEQLLMGGHITEGLELIKSVLAAAGFSLPAGPRSALVSLLLRRLQIRLRGFDFVERKASEIPESDLLRIDVCWAVTAGIGVVDHIRGADFQSRHLLQSLRAGEPYRVARAMACEAVQTAARGGHNRERHLQILKRSEELAVRVNNSHALGLAQWAIGAGAYLLGYWRRAAEFCERAAEILRDRCTGVAWELTTANRFMLSAMLYHGDIAEISRRVPILLEAALDQGNLFAAMDLRTRLNLVWLAADDPERARAEVIEGLRVWSHDGFHLQHYTSMHALAQIELYTGDSEVAWKHVQGQWADLERSLLLRIQILRIEAMHLRARVALASALDQHDPARLAVAEKMAKRIAKDNMPWSAPLVSLVMSAVAHQRGNLSRAVALLKEAVERFERAEMYLYAAAARRRLGELMGGDYGEKMIADADGWMRDQEILNPKLMSRMLAPGFGER